MNQPTFEKDIAFIEPVFNSASNEWDEGYKTAKATFKELSRTDRTQHRLHFLIVAIFKIAKIENTEETTVNIDEEKLYDLTVAAINALLIVDKDIFTEADKKCFLNDSGALMKFGFWILNEKISPFFAKLMRT